MLGRARIYTKGAMLRARRAKRRLRSVGVEIWYREDCEIDGAWVGASNNIGL